MRKSDEELGELPSVFVVVDVARVEQRGCVGLQNLRRDVSIGIQVSANDNRPVSQSNRGFPGVGSGDSMLPAYTDRQFK